VVDHLVKEGKTERLIFNEAWLDFLSHYGSTGKACKPNRPETKDYCSYCASCYALSDGC
jgi:transposase